MWNNMDINKQERNGQAMKEMEACGYAGGNCDRCHVQKTCSKNSKKK